MTSNLSEQLKFLGRSPPCILLLLYACIIDIKMEMHCNA
jgi:hypothetical protein